MERDIASLKNTHLMMWLKDGWNHCRRGSQDWCQGYLNSAHDYIEALERDNASLRSELDEARNDLKRANEMINAALGDYRAARQQAFEEAATIAERVGRLVGGSDGGTYIPGTSRDAAAAIRQKGEQP